jgi:cobyrinic acid a,c-diamide synthase
LPVVLVVDARGMSRSIAPIVRGFAEFDPDVLVAGVIANKVGSRRHFDDYLAPALVQSCPTVEPLGYVSRVENLSIPSRHLGLRTADESTMGSFFFEALADAAEETIDLDRIIKLSRIPKLPSATTREEFKPGSSFRLAWARDPAFCFYYEDNLDLFRDAGAEVVPFSPLVDRQLPENCGLLYLGGGYPELFAERLANNTSMVASIRRFHDSGGAILAECGGMMACCRELIDGQGRSFPMWDLIPARVSMQSRFAALGYVTIATEEPTMLGPSGTTIRGHEFHYSTLEPLGQLDYVTRLERPGRESKPDGIRVGGLLAGYAHLHLGSNPSVARNLLDRTR